MKKDKLSDNQISFDLEEIKESPTQAKPKRTTKKVAKESEVEKIENIIVNSKSWRKNKC